MVCCNSNREKEQVERLNLFIENGAVFGDKSASVTCRKDQGWTEVMACQKKKWWEWRQISSWFSKYVGKRLHVRWCGVEAFLIKSTGWECNEQSYFVLCWTNRDRAYCFVLRVSINVLLISCSLVVAFQYFLCYVHGEGQQASKKEQKYIAKRLASFIVSLILWTCWREVSPIYSKAQLHVTLYTIWEGYGVFYFVLQKELYFLCFLSN